MINLDKKFDTQNISPIKRWSLIISGYLLIFLGIMGLFLPVMPSTIFFILAAASFLRSSEKNYKRLINNRFIGTYIRNYTERRGMTRYSKFMSISFLWISLVISSFFVGIWVKFLLLAVGIGVTIHISKLKEVDKKNKEKITEVDFSEAD